MASQIKLRRGTASQWSSQNPTLAEGEIGFEIDTNKIKIGNGNTNWLNLEYLVDLSSYLTIIDASENYATKEYADNSASVAAASIVDSSPESLNTLNELAAALNDDANFATTVTNSLSSKLDISSALTTYAKRYMEFKDKTSVSNTLNLNDDSKFVRVSNSSANTLQVPLNSNSAFPIGSQITIMQTGTGQTTITAESGVALVSSYGFKLRAQYSSATLIKLNTDQWVAVGDLVF